MIRIQQIRDILEEARKDFRAVEDRETVKSLNKLTDAIELLARWTEETVRNEEE